MEQLQIHNINIAATGYYLGMASCSILEPVVYLYDITRNPRYLSFAKSIVSSIEREGSSQLITKTLKNIPVSEQFQLFQNLGGHSKMVRKLMK